MASRAQWIGWFSNGKKPLGTQFADVLTLLFKKDEDTLPIASVNGLAAALAGKADAAAIANINNSVVLPSGTASWEVPAGTLIEKLLIIAPTGLMAFKVGTVAGGEDIIEPYEIADGYSVYQKDIYFSINTTIYFGGIAGDTIIKILKR